MKKDYKKFYQEVKNLCESEDLGPDDLTPELLILVEKYSNKDTTRYRTIKVLKNFKLIGQIVVASKPVDDSKRKFVIGAAFYSTPDPINKEEARTIARGRMECERSSYIIEMAGNEPAPLVYYIKELLPTIANQTGKKGAKWFFKGDEIV